MPLDNPQMGPNFIPAYQISAIPYVTSSTAPASGVVELDFAWVTRFIVVRNTSIAGSTNVLKVGFTENGLHGSNYFSLASGESFDAEFRVKSLFLSSSSGTSTPYTVIAGLTTVDAKYFPILTGSSDFGGGVG